MLLRLIANSVSAAGLTYITWSSLSRSTTAVASSSRPGKTAGIMREEKWHDRGGGATHRYPAAPGARRPRILSTPPGSGEQREPPLPEPAEFAAKLLDVLRVLVDRFLIRLESIQHPGVVAFVAVAGSLLLGELLPGAGEQLLFVLQLRFEYPAAVFVARPAATRCCPRPQRAPRRPSRPHPYSL